MNFFAHLLVSYAIGAKLAGWPYTLVAVIFGTIPDIDHLLHLRKAASTGRFGCESRSFLHELPGLSLMTLAAIALSVWVPFGIMFYPLLLHHIMDFLTRPTRPFYPVSDTIIHMGIYPQGRWNLIVADTILTAGVVLLWLLVS